MGWLPAPACPRQRQRVMEMVDMHARIYRQTSRQKPKLFSDNNRTYSKTKHNKTHYISFFPVSNNGEQDKDDNDDNDY